jgi:hypothetical protein
MVCANTSLKMQLFVALSLYRPRTFPSAFYSVTIANWPLGPEIRNLPAHFIVCIVCMFTITSMATLRNLGFSTNLACTDLCASYSPNGNIIRGSLRMSPALLCAGLFEQVGRLFQVIWKCVYMLLVSVK